MKFKDQKYDLVNSNDFISKVFDSNANRRHKHFKCFFTLRDPRCPIPSKKTNPNYKVDKIFKQFNEVSLDAHDPGMNLVTYKQD